MNFSGVTILVIGDVMLDHYITGTADRVSPEAPVAVVNRRQSWAVPGGAANVARSLARLGCHVRLIGLAGKDATGETLRNEIAAEGIQAALVSSDSRPTICKTRIMAHGQQLLRVDEETVQAPSLEEMVAMRVHCNNMLPGCDAVILSDYAKGCLLRDRNGKSICSEVIGLAGEADIPVLVDPKGIDWERYRGAQCVTPNTAEFRKICESLGAHNLERMDAEIRVREQLADNLCHKFGIDRILLTRGANGMNLFTPATKPLRIQATMREVADVSGAGDTVIATLTACRSLGISWPESAAIANTAAGVAVGKIGTAPVSVAELNQALAQNEKGSCEYTLPELLARLEEWRNEGHKIVFTNGCFDLLHPGHISLLKKSAEFGDRLVVGLNSDSSVKRLKGNARPVQNEKDRAALLAALKPVDAVIVFNEDTPADLIRAIKPDVLVKGGDYKLNEVVGADFVTSYGGQTRLVELVKGHSTTGMVEKIKSS